MVPYERFDAWRLCHELALAVWEVTKSWPKSELFGLTSQARRAAFSAPANLVEGSAKRGSREFRRFLDISLGSLAELSYIIRFARDLDFLADTEWEKLEERRNRAGQLVWRLKQSLDRDLRQGASAVPPSRRSAL